VKSKSTGCFPQPADPDGAGLWRHRRPARLLGQLGFYKLVWHRSLMNFALYVIVLGGFVVLTRGW
jgi:hypothetical protein